MPPIRSIQFVMCCLMTQAVAANGLADEFRAGAAKVDITPQQLPVLVNGSMTSRSADQITTRIHARAIVLADDDTRIGIVVVDSCMVPRTLCDEAKQLAAQRTSLAADRILISATHTHTAPSSMGALGTNADATYVPFLRQQLSEALVRAEANLRPAKVGWGSTRAEEFTALRRWVRRPDRVGTDPFGNPTVRATMHAARNPDEAIGPTGPEDPELSCMALEDMQGKPIAVLANFSMHYFGGERAISADYFGRFCDELEDRLDKDGDFGTVAIMSHGCSGDIWRRDYMRRSAVEDGSVQDYSLGLVDKAEHAMTDIEFEPSPSLEMLESRLNMSYRVPNSQRLQWAREVVDGMGERLPKTQPEIYAREQLFLDAAKSTEVVVQAIRIGERAIVTTPCETYALTGLKLKLQSPAVQTMVIELANGGDGYIPPPEQHAMGGYNTWAARSAGLEKSAEPRIVAENLRLLEQLFAKPRRVYTEPLEATAKKIMELEPLAFYRMNEFGPAMATDSSPHGHHGQYEAGVLYFLDGPAADETSNVANRCTHFAGGRLRANLPVQSGDFTVSLAFWNGMPLDVRDTTGWIFSHDYADGFTDAGIHIGLDRHGQIKVLAGRSAAKSGGPIIERWQWHHLTVTRREQQLRVFVDGRLIPELTTELKPANTGGLSWFFGGRSDFQANSYEGRDYQSAWEGRLDEIAIFPRGLSAYEVDSISPKQRR